MEGGGKGGKGGRESDEEIEISTLINVKRRRGGEKSEEEEAEEVIKTDVKGRERKVRELEREE